VVFVSTRKARTGANISMWSTGRDKMFPNTLFMKTNEGGVQKITDRVPNTGRAGSHLFRSLLESA